MFDQKYEDRLSSWSCLRQSLEVSTTPLKDLIEAYDHAPRVSIHTDPWDKATWPSPWELVLENQYCQFCIVLGMAYSLQLTERFKGSNFEIHIGIDRDSKEQYYLLFVNNHILGWNNTCIDRSELPQSFVSQTVYTLDPLQ